ncbi:glycosyltransferase family 4 protein [Clavibacter michiganensis]|uniref:glycosyltransferase family 4 protein n=1 Tax=Clavibacter michiganensis TaxID=28447 RepID=UPI001BE02577|nr:glycosyltransferase family 4 protein [Clavibacter michiganensis]MBT1635921.1 glycosyltransferase family 4 protein [Clavibacter michiganensis]
MRILQLLLRPQIGGAETLVASLAAEWRRLGHTSELAYLDPEGASTGKVARGLRLRRVIRDVDPDLVVSHSALPNLYSAIVTPRRTPLLSVLHSATDDFASTLLRQAEARSRTRARTVVAVSRKQVDEYAAHFPGRPRPVLVPNGISGDLPRRPDRTPRPPRVITMARVASQKEPELWLDVVDRFALADPGVAFSWRGPVLLSDPRIARFWETVRAHGHDDLLAGPSGDVGADLAAADLCFHPSSREAHSIGVLEAAAVGLPVVCSADVAATLPSYVPAATFVSGDAASAVAAIRSVLDDHPAALARAVTTSARVREEYSIGATARAYLRIAGVAGPGEPAPR